MKPSFYIWIRIHSIFIPILLSFAIHFVLVALQEYYFRMWDTGSLKNILLIDDDQDDYFLFDEAIKKTSFNLTITHVSNFIEAMAYLTSEIPDLIFLDLNMPFKNGLDALVEFKQNENLRDIPVVIYSSSGYARDIKTAYERGAALYFIKPSSFEELILCLSQIINKNWSAPKAITAGYLIDDLYVPFAAEPI